MKNKTTLILGIVFILLLVYYLVTSLNPPEITSGARLLFEGMKPDIDRVEFSSVRRGNIVLEKRSGGWYLTEPFKYKAYDIQVESMLEDLFKTYIDIEDVDSDPESHDEYRVGESSGTSFKIFSDDELILDVIVGRQTREFGHSYARMNGSDTVELWRGMLSQDMTIKAEEWRDRVLYRFNESDVIAVEAVEGNNTRSLTLDNQVWTFKENGVEKPVDMVKAQSIVALFAGLKCDEFGFGGEIPRAGSNPPKVNVTFTVRNSDRHTLDIWTPDDISTRYLARKAGGDMLYIMNALKGSKLILDYEQLK